MIACGTASAAPKKYVTLRILESAMAGTDEEKIKALLDEVCAGANYAPARWTNGDGDVVLVSSWPRREMERKEEKITEKKMEDLKEDLDNRSSLSHVVVIS